MAVFNKFECFTGDLGDKVHSLDIDVLKVYLTNVAPSTSADTVKVDIVEIISEHGYPSGGTDIQGVWNEINGTGILTSIDEIVWFATGGAFGPVRYAVLYNDTPTSPADPLIAWWEYPGGSVIVNEGETFTVDFLDSVLTLT